VPLKVIEAMARAKAVVASPELIDGLAVEDSKDLLVRRTPDDFASAVVALLGDASRREQLGVHARATFVRDFSISSGENALRRSSVLMNK
jgi:glycosyltransferase involved in cell wall biosynthesis